MSTRSRADIEISKRAQKPITTETIRWIRGMLKRVQEQKPLAEEWAEHKKTERELEDA